MKKFSYDISKYRFIELLERLFVCTDLSQTHTVLPNHITYSSTFNNKNDNRTWFHEKFYHKINNYWKEFDEQYFTFVKKEISPHFKDEIIFQSNPTFRIHMPNNVAVGKGDQTAGFHRDSDPGYNHPLAEFNIFLPLTKAFKSNTIWVESETGKEDYSPMEASPGEYYLWKGTQLSHGNKVNTTNSSRISFVFRVLQKTDYKPESFSSTADRNKKFAIGQYYREFK